MVVASKDMVTVKFDAKTITEKQSTEKMTSILKLMTEAKSEAIYKLYIMQLHTMVVEILKVHKDYKIKEPVMASYSEMQTIQKNITHVTYNAKTVTKVQSAQLITDIMAHMSSCHSETEYAIYSAQLNEIVTSISSAHKDFKVEMPMVVDFHKMQEIKSKVKFVKYDAKKITSAAAATIQTEFMTHIAACKDETSYAMYTAQLSQCIKSIMAAHSDYKMEMPQLVSFNEMAAIKKSVTTVHFDAKKITKVEVAHKAEEI
jgi:hypothetical protein